ncbi:hypothetical protein [Pseudorhodoplanes sp.]|uniref:hypothetical protein n=1 Tax=Pseudorhodoplanes sp. TaxID=1934341 RepID=UPI003D0E883A
MRTVLRLTIAGLLIVSALTAATAQVSQRGGAPRYPGAANIVSDPYGERSRDPNAVAPCSQRPFALGCDKRGFW